MTSMLLSSSMVTSDAIRQSLAATTVNHGAKIRIHFFSLRLERSALYNPHFCIYWQPIVDDHMSKRSKTKLMLKENSFEWDSGFSDG